MSPQLRLPIGQRMRLLGKAVTGLFGPNASTVAHGLLSGLYPGGSGPPAQRGSQALLDAYSTMPWLRAVSQKISQTVAETQWTLSVQTGSRKRGGTRTLQRAIGDHRVKLLRAAMQRGDLKELDSHPMLDALYSANDFIVGNALWRLTAIYLDLIGEAFWIKERDALGTPTGFWPIPPSWITRTPTVRLPSYRASFMGWQGDIPDTEVVWFLDPDPANPYGRGSGLARTLADELETDEYASHHSRMVFLNRARPDFIVWPKGAGNAPGEMGEPAARRMGERWLADHQGFWRAAQPFFSTRELGIYEMGQSFADLQLTELRKFERDTIVQTYGMPPELLGILEHSNRATIDAADYLFKKNIVVPRLEFLRGYLQERVAPEYDEALIVGYVSPVSEDRAAQVEAGKAAPWSLTADEWRGLIGFEPLKDATQGSVHMVPSGYLPSTDLAQPPVTAQPILQPAGAAAFRRDLVDGDGWAQHRQACADAGDAASLRIVAKALAADPEDLPPLSQVVARQERAFRREVERVLAATAAVPVASVAEALAAGADAVVALVDWPAFGTALRAAAEPALEGAFRAGVSVGGTDAGLTRGAKADAADVFNVSNQLAVSHAEAQAAKLVTGITQATREGIRQAVTEALTHGWGAEKTARIIRASIGLTAQQAGAVVAFANRLAEADTPITDAKLFARVGRYTEAQRAVRALTIARTELATSASAGQQAVWNEAIKAGLLDKAQMVKVWLVANDELLEKICESLADEEVAIDAPFSTGDMGPPAHPNCRCSSGLKLKGKAAIVVVRRPDTPIAAALRAAVRSGFAGALDGVVEDSGV